MVYKKKNRSVRGSVGTKLSSRPLSNKLSTTYFKEQIITMPLIDTNYGSKKSHVLQSPYTVEAFLYLPLFNVRKIIRINKKNLLTNGIFGCILDQSIMFQQHLKIFF